MKSLKNKLLLSVWMLVATLVTLASTTYAWFASNREVILDEFDMELDTQQNLLISVDGENFSSRISKDDLKKAISAKYKGVSFNEAQASDFDDVKFEPVTTYDLNTFKEISNNLDEDKNYILTDTDVKKGQFISFDLWFQYTSFKNDSNSYYITFVGDTYAEKNNTVATSISGSRSEVILNNSLVTPEKSYKSGETIEIDTGGALRLGVTTSDNQNLIYEPNLGIASYAIDGETDDRYNPDMNPMLTYFNNLNLGNLKPITENKDFYKNTIKSFDTNQKLATLVNENNSFNNVKITVYVWLEGMDADYIIGCTDTNLKMVLNFCVKEVEEVQ